jgi:hypothetical protein
MNTLTLPEEDLPFQIAKLEMKPGDVLVLRPTRPIVSEAASRLHAYVSRAFPDRKILVIGSDVDLSVVSARKATRRSAGTEDGADAAQSDNAPSAADLNEAPAGHPQSI